jgi:hypothetical protein
MIRVVATKKWVMGIGDSLIIDRFVRVEYLNNMADILKTLARSFYTQSYERQPNLFDHIVCMYKPYFVIPLAIWCHTNKHISEIGYQEERGGGEEEEGRCVLYMHACLCICVAYITYFIGHSFLINELVDAAWSKLF